MSLVSPRQNDGGGGGDEEKKSQTLENIKHIPFVFIFLCTLCMSAIYANPTVYQSTINFLHEFRNFSESDYFSNSLTIDELGANQVSVTTNGYDKIHISVMLTARSDGFKCRPFVLLPKKGPITSIIEKFGSSFELTTDHITTSLTTSLKNDETLTFFLKSIIGTTLFGKRLLVWDSYRSYRYHISTDTKKVMRNLRVDMAVIPVYEETDKQYDPETQLSRDVVFKYVYYLSNPQKESLITVTSVGTVLAATPITYAYNNMGFRRSFVMCAFISVIPALFFPICVNAKTYLLAIILRIFQGCSLAAFIPYICKLSVFIPFDHISVPVIVFAYSHISEMFVHPIVSHMASSSLGWHSAHYGAVITIVIIFFIFVLIHFDEDFKERSTTIGFCNAMFEYERTRSRTFDLRIPYLSIYQDFRIWVIFFTSFAYGCALQLFYQFGPTFFHKVVGHSEISSAYLTIIAPAFNLVTSCASIYLSGRLANSEQNKMRFFNTTAFATCGIFLFALGFFDPANHKYVVTVMYILASSLLGCSAAGHLRMNQIRSGHLHLFLLVNIFIVNSAAMFFSSLLNVLIAKNTDYSSWSTLFIVHAIFLIIANAIFFCFCSSERAPWAKEGYEDSSIQPYRDEPLPQFPL